MGIGGGKLKFDFICESKDNRLIAIEYDGKHHFMTVKFSTQNSDEDAEMDFERTIYHDELKDYFCIENDIKMYRLKGNIEEQAIINIIDKENL